MRSITEEMRTWPFSCDESVTKAAKEEGEASLILKPFVAKFADGSTTIVLGSDVRTMRKVLTHFTPYDGPFPVGIDFQER